MIDNLYTIIVTYDGMEWIERCLHSLEDSSNIIVVDNGSTDETVDFISNNFKCAHLIQSGENLGFGAANNIGIQHAMQQGAEYIFLLNQDAWIEKGTTKLLVDTIQKNPEYGVISPIHLNGTGEMLDRSFGDYLYNQGGRKFITDKICNRSTEKLINIDFVNAAAWLVTRNCIEKVGLFDSIFSHYGEDNNYLQRTVFHNLKVGIMIESFILHDREDRKGTHMKNDFTTELRMLKKYWADVNENDEDIEKDIQKKLSVKKRVRNKKMLLLKISEFKDISSQIIEIKKVAEACQLSRIKNRQVYKKLKLVD